jgi:hypothetical protein
MATTVHAHDADAHAEAASANTSGYYGAPTQQSAAAALMVIYEIPFEPADSTDWHVDISTDGRRNFESRQAALAFARTSAQAREVQSGVAACISIQGGDGRWRTFDSQLEPVRSGPEILG